ncbi:MAG: hypothetical protein AB4058_12575, partial [Microcystaceae cyanobacterium]
LKNTTQPRLWLEVTLLGLLPSSHTSQTVVVASPTATTTATPTVNRQPVAVTPAVTPVKPSVSPSPSVESAKREVESGKREEVNSPPPPATNDLNGIWQAFLGYLSPLTSTLMQQQGQLANLQENAAYINLKSEPLLRMAKGKQAELESALQKVCQRQIRVHLQVGTSQPIPPSASPSQPSKKVSPPSPPKEKPHIAPPPATHPSPKVTTTPITTPTTHQAPKPAPPPPSSTPSNPSPATPSQPITDQEISTAIESFAKAFSGEIVDLDYPEDEVILDSSVETETVTTPPDVKESDSTPQPQPTRIKGRPQLTEDEEDIPF